MNPELLKWLSALVTGLLAVVAEYLVDYAGDPTTPIEGVDPLVSFIVITLVARLASWLVSLIGPPKPIQPLP